jgi:hypothetical protein
MKARIERWKEMVAASDSAADNYLMEITAQAKAEGKLDEMNEVLSQLITNADRHLDNIEDSMAEHNVYQQLGNLYEVINLAYIARAYFGKTRQWLYQRIKGQIVNGKPAKFTSEERATFINALDDIRNQIATATGRL